MKKGGGRWTTPKASFESVIPCRTVEFSVSKSFHSDITGLGGDCASRRRGPTEDEAKGLRRFTERGNKGEHSQQASRLG